MMDWNVAASLFPGWIAFGLPDDEEIVAPELPEREEIAAPDETGNVGDLVDALLLEIADESLTIGNVEDDKDLIFSDGKEVADFIQSVDENEL